VAATVGYLDSDEPKASHAVMGIPNAAAPACDADVGRHADRRRR
jgi:hypothetical protein